LLGYFYLDKGLIYFRQICVLGLYTKIVIPLVAGLCLVEVTFSSKSESLQPFEEFLFGRSDGDFLVARLGFQRYGGWRPGEYDLKGCHTMLLCTRQL
jgi:hypothetical protein